MLTLVDGMVVDVGGCIASTCRGRKMKKKIEEGWKKCAVQEGERKIRPRVFPPFT